MTCVPGVHLDCCFDTSNLVSLKRTLPGACDDNSACAELGVMGICCPIDSKQLDCCNDVENKATESILYTLNTILIYYFGCR